MTKALDARILRKKGGWKPQFLDLREAEAGSPTSWVLGKRELERFRLLDLEVVRGWGLVLLVLGKPQVSLTCCSGRSPPGSQHTGKM